jgi:monoamine oxidase
MKRRDFLQTLPVGALLALGGGSLSACAKRIEDIPVGWLGADPSVAHRLREPMPTMTGAAQKHCDVLIVGAGVAGLSAAWWLARSTDLDIAVLDLQDAAGGNARGGVNATSAFPLGAHYLPSPGQSARHVRQLLADLGVIRGDPFAARPDYDPLNVCFAPQERLWIHGAWQEGLLPLAEPGSADARQYERFAELIDGHLRSGRFRMPRIALALDDPLRALDGLSMRAWMQQQDLNSAALHWYVDYCCRDDYGTSSNATSAYAGVHYFASRHGFLARDKAGAEPNDPVLTWPQGNGWLTDAMRRWINTRRSGFLHTQRMARRVEQDATGVTADVLDLQAGQNERWRAKRAILALPTFVLPHIVQACPDAWSQAAKQLEHAPWLVANLTLNRTPESVDGSPLAWDNVLYDSASLGYVNATHQSLRSRPGPTVWTWYRALAEMSPLAARKLLLETPAQQWVAQAIADLAAPHRGLLDAVERVDLTRYGHAMARPTPGSMFAPWREALAQPSGRLMMAHSDLAGYSVFEEANHYGVRAGEWAGSA